MRRRLILALVWLIGIAGCAACGTSSSNKQQAAPAASAVARTRTVNTQRAAATTAATSATALPTASLTATRASSAKPTAASDIDALKTAGLPIGKIDTYTASSDPNHLLGRPGEYTSKVNFADTRLPADTDAQGNLSVGGGGSIEVSDSASAAEKRAAYVATIAQSAPIFNEYDFRAGVVLLRLSSQLTPDQAKQYTDALTKIVQEPVIAVTAEPATPAP